MATSSEVGRPNSWGRWGAEDERGALNLLTPDVVLRATRSCRTGRVYLLGLPIPSEEIPRPGHRSRPVRLTSWSGSDDLTAWGAPMGLGANEDVFVIDSHSLTHIDALSHVYSDGRFYNDYPMSTFASSGGAARCGIEKLGGFAARATVFDVAAARGEQWLEPGYVVTADDLEKALEASEQSLEPGDVALIRTGTVEMLRTTPVDEVDRMRQAGIGFEAARFLIDHDIAAVGADNAAVEAMPFDRGEFLGIHVELLVRHGIPLIENLDLSGPSRDGCRGGLLVVGPLRVTGATGSPVNPILIG